MISLILAVSDDGAIGVNGGLPWHLPADMKRFRSLTKGHTILMGRRTFESLPHVLPGRPHIVVTHDPSYTVADSRVSVCHDLSSLLSSLRTSPEEVFVIGGAGVYQQCLPYADRIYLTQVHTRVPQADTFLSLPTSGFREVSRSGLQHDEDSGLTYEFIDYVRTERPRP